MSTSPRAGSGEPLEVPAATLTPVLLRTLTFVGAYIGRSGFAPTLAEIAAEFCRSREAVWYALRELERRGMVVRRRYRARCLELTPAGRAAINRRYCPHCGIDLCTEVDDGR